MCLPSCSRGFESHYLSTLCKVGYLNQFIQFHSYYLLLVFVILIGVVWKKARVIQADILGRPKHVKPAILYCCLKLPSHSTKSCLKEMILLCNNSLYKTVFLPILYELFSTFNRITLSGHSSL